MPTIHDVARLAGVSITTVSKVLNGYPDVGAKTRAKILRITKEVGYRPSAMARGLAMSRSWLIGVFFQDAVNSGLEHPFFEVVLNGCKNTVGRHGYDLLFFGNLVFSPGEARNDYLSRARQRQVDGVLLMGVHRHDKELLKLAQADLPCMFIDIDITGPRSGFIESNNREGAKQAVRHLLALGHRRIAVIGDRHGSRPGEDRLAGAREAMTEAGVEWSKEYVEYGDFSQESGYAAMAALLARLGTDRRPTGVFAQSDLMAFGAMDAAFERGLRIPEDLSIVGFDDIQSAARFRPRLTTVRQNMHRIGEKAGESLIRMIEGDGAQPPVLSVETELVVRESTGSAPII